MTKAFDVIVVGARCAGSPTAMLLARKGYRVLAVDRATFPSDTVSTHMVHPLAVRSLAQLGSACSNWSQSGCPPIDTYTFDFGPFTIAGAPGTRTLRSHIVRAGPCSTRSCVDAAGEAGAEMREGFTVEEVVIEDGRVMGIKGHSRGGVPVVESSAKSSSVPTAGDRFVAEAVRPEAV